jgi:hypothetical protein
VLSSELTIFPSETYTITNPKFASGLSGDQEFWGGNPSSSAIITYYMQKRHVFGDMSVEIYNSDGELVKTLPAGKNKGINYVEWAVRKKPPKVKASSPTLAFRTAFGPTFPPGEYVVKVKKGEMVYEGTITLQSDAETGHSDEDMKLQFETLNQSYELLENIAFMDKQVTDLYEKLNSVNTKIEDEELKTRIETLSKQLDAIHQEMVATNPNRLSGEIRLSEKVADIYSGIIYYLGRPTDSQIASLNLLEGVYKDYRKEVDSILSEQLTSINSELKNLGLGEIKAITEEEYNKS